MSGIWVLVEAPNGARYGEANYGNADKGFKDGRWAKARLSRPPITILIDVKPDRPRRSVSGV